VADQGELLIKKTKRKEKHILKSMSLGNQVNYRVRPNNTAAAPSTIEGAFTFGRAAPGDD